MTTLEYDANIPSIEGWACITDLNTIIDLEAVIKTVCGMDAAVELIGMY